MRNITTQLITRISCLCLLCFLSFQTQAQCNMCKAVLKTSDLEERDLCFNDLKVFEHYTITEKGDTVRFHLYLSGAKDSIENILVYAHGSGFNPLYRIKHTADGMHINSQVPISTRTIPKKYAFVLVSKPDIPFCLDSMDYTAPTSFFMKESLDKRVKDVDVVVRYVRGKLFPNAKKTIALGHSEGSDVIAKLGTLNKSITHFGYLSGGGHSQWYDFPLMIRKQAAQGKMTDQESIEQIDSLLEQYKLMNKHKTSTDSLWQGNTFKRWASFGEPPINNLLKIDRPIYMAIGSNDRSVPIESAYLIPVEFIRNNKQNLTFKVYTGLSHNFAKTNEEGKYESHWEEVMEGFFKWIDEN